jgi:hypothetical protein
MLAVRSGRQPITVVAAPRATSSNCRMADVDAAPGVNPQEAIMALATIIARRIIDRHPSGGAGHRKG